MKLTRLFAEFFNSEKVGGLILLFCTIFTLIIANTVWRDSYSHFWHSYIDLSFYRFKLHYSIEHWINDGLMTVFFLLVGLEIERELYIGELNPLHNAVLPIAGAVGGMVVPALIHFLLNYGTNTQQGFGIPMATDIAFALGMLSLLGNRIPYSIKVFLTALAIIDDLGAILVIAIFYNTGISWLYLGWALAIFAMLMIINLLKVRKLVFYILPGIVMWYCMLKSGVHATISGVLLAFAIPFTTDDASNPSYKLQHFLHKPVAFIILPLFALANTGLILGKDWLKQILDTNSLGIILGLVVGKPLGILLFSWTMIRIKWCNMPQGINWKLLGGAAILAGIGFTMSIFISNLAFTDLVTIRFSKIAVLLASFIATLLGLIVLYSTSKTPTAVVKE